MVVMLSVVHKFGEGLVTWLHMAPGAQPRVTFPVWYPIFNFLRSLTIGLMLNIQWVPILVLCPTIIHPENKLFNIAVEVMGIKETNERWNNVLIITPHYSLVPNDSNWLALVNKVKTFVVATNTASFQLFDADL